MNNFILEFFAKPIENLSGYNIFNTLVYAVILLVVAFYVVFPFFDKRKIKFDFNFFKSVFPYILFGSSLRVLEDLSILPRSSNPLNPAFYTLSPGIYIFVGLFAIFALILSLKLSKDDYSKAIYFFGLFGIIPAFVSFFFVLFFFKNLFGFLLVIILVSFISFFFFRFFKGFFKEPMSKVAFFSQVFDGSATFIAIQFFSYGEQHVFSGILTSFSPVSFLIIKIVFVLIAIFLINKFLHKKSEHNLKLFLFLFISIIGLAPALRDLFRLALAT